MAVRPEQLPAALERGLAPVYFLAGAEPLLLQECRDQVIRAAQAAGYAERTVYETHAKFDWAQIGEASAAPSLFSSLSILDVRLPTGKPGQDGAKALIALAENPDPDTLLLVSSGDWSKAIRNLKWARSLAAAGLLVEIWPVRPNELPGWIRARMRAVGLQPDNDAVALLAELVEGNLLAAQQEIDKLLLAGFTGRLEAEDITRAVANSARFDSFRLVDCALSGQLDECLRVASGLERTGTAIQLVSAAMYKEINVADAVRTAVDAGEHEGAVFQRMRIWPQRQNAIRQALGRLSSDDFGAVFRGLALVDQQSKGQAPGEPWQTLDRLLWFLCDPKAVRGQRFDAFLC